MTPEGEFHPLEIQLTRLTCQLTIVPPAPWPDISGGSAVFAPVSAEITLLKKVGYSWVGDSVVFRGINYPNIAKNPDEGNPGILVRSDIFPLFMADSFRWAVQYAENRWREVGISDRT